MQCPKCQFENPEDSLFCGGCGAAIEVSCPICGSTAPANFKFCNKCGHDLSKPQEEPDKDLSFDQKIENIKKYLPEGLTEKILSQKERIEGERKQVTVMFCDMEGFTPLSEMLGIEDAYTIMDQIYEILIHKVQDFEGTVNEMTGDGIMALFGAPIALEDAPQRAIRSSLAIHRELAKFSYRLRHENSDIPSMKMRIGIHTGPVVVGTVGNDLRVEFKAVGDTVNLASRMEGLAKPGTTYVTDDTFELTEGLFRFESLGKKEVKGKKEAVNVYRVIAPSSRRTRFDVNTERGLTPLSGRDRELELLLDCLEHVKRGSGQSFSIISEAGMGKSRLLYEFRKAVANEELTFLEGRCFSYSKSIAYHPIIDILKSNYGIQENDDDNDIRKKVKNIFDLYGTDESSIMPFILELLSVKESGIDKLLLNSEALRNRIFEALKKIVLIGAEIRPLILAIEDLHWVDRTSQDFTSYLLDYISGHRVLLIFTFRPEYSHTWKRKSFFNEVNLNRLSNRESLLMATNFLKVDKLDRDLEDLILEKTEGVPFFIEEFIKSLDDMGVIKHNKRCYLAKDIQNLVIPSTVHDVIMSRIDSLPSAVKKILLIGSVIGREFDYNLIKFIAELSETELLTHLSELRKSEHIYERGIYPKVTYIFKHALIQDVAFQSLLKSKRREYHKKIAYVMEQHFPEIAQTNPEVVGHHFTKANSIKRAIPYWQKAGKIAIRRSANLEAADHFSLAIKMLETLPDYSQRSRQELNLLTAYGPALMATKGYAAEEVEKTFVRAKELCQHLGESTQLFNVSRGLWGHYIVIGELQMAHDQGQQCLAFAQKERNTAMLMWANFMLGQTLFHLGEISSARNCLEKGVELYDPLKRGVHKALQDPGVACLSYNAVALLLLGYPDQALKTSNESLDLAHKLNHPFSLMYALYMASVISQMLQKVEESLERADAANALCTEYGGQPFWLAWGPMLRGWAQCKLGRIEDGIAEECKGLAAYNHSGSILAQPYFISLQAEMYLEAGLAEEGIRVLKEALLMLKKSREQWWEAELHRLMGKILLAVSHHNRIQAEECFNRALGIARRQSTKTLELRAAMSLGQLWQTDGKIDKARQLVIDIYDWFNEGFDTPDLRQAKQMLDELG